MSATIAETVAYISAIMPALIKGAEVTLRVFLLTLVFALPLGLPIALGSNSRLLPIKLFCRAYVWVFRGTPLLLQLFFFFYMLPIWFGFAMDPLPTAVITFVLNYSAYLAEIYRGGINSIDRGQYEAASCLGLGRWQTMFGIILPQTVSRILPAVANEMITLVKDTSLVYVIGVAELMKASRGAVNRDTDPTAYLVAALIYLLFTFILTKVANRVEKRFSRHEARRL